MRIDSHHHVWTYSALDYPWVERSLPELRRDFTAEEFETTARGAGYSGSIAVQSKQSLDETRFLLGEARRHPFISGVVGWVDLRAPDLETLLDELGGKPLVGVRHVVHDEPDGFMLRPDVLRGLAVLEERGLAFDMLLLPKNLAEAASVVGKFPRLQFVLDHLGKPLEQPRFEADAWKESLSLLAKHPNVSAKVSGLFTESSPSRWDEATIGALLDTAFELFGPQRLLASSNWPVCLVAGSYAWTMGWVERYVERFPAPIPELVLGGNASRVYCLDRG